MIGAGPAGLSAATYLARYLRRVAVLHDGASRAQAVPLTHNVPGFPDGVTGPDLLRRLEAQAARYGALIIPGRVDRLERTTDGFRAVGKSGAIEGRALILATGVVHNQLDLPPEVHAEAVRCACVRYCPICDGYEARGKDVAVLGGDVHGASEAMFLRQFTDRVSLLAAGPCQLSDAQRRELVQADVAVIDSPVAAVVPDDGGVDVRLRDGRSLRFGVLYPALGVRPRSELAAQLGVDLTEGGCIPADVRQSLSIPGLYAAGDVVEALDQISVAFGHGAIAATQAHNWLREQDRQVLSAG